MYTYINNNIVKIVARTIKKKEPNETWNQIT